MPTTLRLGIQMITILESIHDMGYVHRDVKPVRFILPYFDIRDNYSIFITHYDRLICLHLEYSPIFCSDLDPKSLIYTSLILA